MKYYPQLDGLRAISVMLVLFFHLPLAGFSFGGFGVQIFFALSGFLITAILLGSKERAEGSFKNYLKNFYIRRALRIFPLYYLYLAVNALVVLIFGKSLEGYLYYIFYVQNYHLAATYFENPPGIIGHTWSLAVEEQFYLIWPIVVYFLSKRCLLVVSLFVAAGSVFFRHYTFQQSGNPFSFFVYLPSSLDALCLGGAFAVLGGLRESVSNICAKVGLVISLVGIGWVFSSIDLEALWTPKSWIPDYGLLLFFVGLLGSSLIVVLIRGGWFARMLEQRYLVKIGQISYGLYIWHPFCYQTVKVLSERTGIVNNTILIMAKLVSTFVVAYISFNLFEMRFLRLKDKFTG